MLQSDWLAQVDRLPQDWALVAVSKNKRPYNPDHPQGREWQKNPLPRDRFKTLNGQFGAVGLLLGPVSGGLVAIDHDGPSATTKIEELSGLPILEALPMTVGFTSGRLGRYQVVYQVPEQYWGAICTRKIATGAKDPTDGKDELVEFRWKGAQSVILGYHPDTDGYSWVPGRAPWEIEVAECPTWVIEQMLDETPEHVNAPRTDWRIERPLERPIPLVHLLTKKHAIDVENGASDGTRNDTGAALARDLIGCENWARGAGVHFEGSAQELFWQFADRSGLPGKESKTIWRSAERDNPGPARSDDGLRVAVKWWENQYRAKVVGSVSKPTEEVTEKTDDQSLELQPDKALRVTEKKPQRLTFEQLIEAMRDLEICHGFLTSKYMWALENFAEDIKRPARFLQSVYNRSLSETCDVKDETFAEVSKQSPEEIPWLIPDMLYRGATTIFHAAGGCGKTLLIYNLIKALSVTGEFLGVPTSEKVRCGLIQIDEPKPAFTERIKELQMDETDNLVKLDWSFGLVSSLDKWITDNNLGLVVIDSFFAAQKFAETKENDSDHAAVLMRLRDIAQRSNSSIVIVHHSNKQGGMRGSGAIQGAVSEVWHLTKPDPEKHGQYKLKGDERIFECEKTRMVTPFKMALALDGDTLTWRNLGDLTRIDNGTIDEPATPLDRIKAFIDSAANPFTISDLIDNRVLSIGVSRDAAKLILNRLKKKGFVRISEQSSGKTETKWISPRFCKNPDTVDTVSPQTHTQQGKPTVSSTVSEPYQEKSDTVTQPYHQENDTVDDTVNDTVSNVYTASDTAQPYQPYHQNSEILERIQKTEKSTYVPRPSSEYTGPPVGTIVRFSDQGVAPKEIKALQQRGINYPWGLTGRISDVFATTGNRYAATVTTDDLGTYTVRDFLALEVLELPEESRKVASADQPWDDSVQPDLEW